MTDSPLGALKLLQWTSSVEDYCEKFMALACRDAELSKMQQTQLFIAGLRNPLQIDVAFRKPSTLNDAITFTRAYEQRLLLSEFQQPRPGPRFAYRPSISAAPTASGAASTSPQQSVYSFATTMSVPMGSTMGRRRLNPTEMAQRHAMGLCYNCDEKFVYGHKCKKLFILEVAPEDEEAEGAQEPEVPLEDLTISLHALTGIRSTTYDTMRFWVHVGKNCLTALLDSGSTHNFMHPDMAADLLLPAKRRTTMRVTVGNGDQVPFSGMFPELSS
ncbi:hypothetical protein BS78_03G205500 [Paspalum vaginatum]|nr:hypothetical protein BS78_03G205500 [Paspalum vaginatum]